MYWMSDVESIYLVILWGSILLPHGPLGGLIPRANMMYLSIRVDRLLRHVLAPCPAFLLLIRAAATSLSCPCVS
ncbi:protein of unknown function [Candidatus Nitrospira inopinata]|uniref:Uncharacterized protein n=1 Tax=Candidatus Nitrospira inopinata TaxID=1715989 RepID=A0A0S4KMT3_9BACT|nr:protein of unknown function [Candidatus Nitrospira inopinata]